MLSSGQLVGAQEHCRSPSAWLCKASRMILMSKTVYYLVVKLGKVPSGAQNQLESFLPLSLCFCPELSLCLRMVSGGCLFSCPRDTHGSSVLTRQCLSWKSVDIVWSSRRRFLKRLPSVHFPLRTGTFVTKSSTIMSLVFIFMC